MFSACPAPECSTPLQTVESRENGGRYAHYSGVGTAGAPGAGAPVKFLKVTHVAARKLRCVAKLLTLARNPKPSPFTRALPVFSGVHAHSKAGLRCMHLFRSKSVLSC